MTIHSRSSRPNVQQPLLRATIFDAIDKSHLTQRQIAEAVGLSNANVISMWRHGDRIPAERVCALASVLGLDPGETLLLALFETYPVIARQLADEGLLSELPIAHSSR